MSTTKDLARILLLTALVAVYRGEFPGSVFAEEDSSAVNLLEHRAPPAPSVGTRKLDVGFEIASPLPTLMPSVLKLKDGRLAAFGEGKASFSENGGQTWSAAQDLPARIAYAIRLSSGTLAAPVQEGPEHAYYTSDDEGKTWIRRGLMRAGPVPGFPHPKTLLQTKSGRLVLPVRFIEGAGHEGQYDRSGAFGHTSGKLTKIEGHAHFPEPDISFLFYSDDDGVTWNRSEGSIMVWHKDGHGGMWPCDEPSVIETQNGELLMFCRTSLGRIYTARSAPVDYTRPSGEHIVRSAGQRFDLPLPTDLASSYSPSAITRIPSTGDLLMVWNQVSGDEIRAGFRRGRLSSAISRDDGSTWEHFRTVDVVGLPPAGRVAPDPEPQMARGLDYVGVLPENYGGVDYPSINLVDDTVFLFFSRTVLNPRQNVDVVGLRMRTVPLSWFYEEEQPLTPGPKLILQIPASNGNSHTAVAIFSTYFDGQFFVNSNDVARQLPEPTRQLGANMFAPVHQVITALGWEATYDNDAADKANPRFIVTVKPGQADPATK